jgi:hypothetical protein
MINLQYRKGTPCICSSVFCQEGYCSECDIYSNNVSKMQSVEQAQTNTYRAQSSLTKSKMAIVR